MTAHASYVDDLVQVEPNRDGRDEAAEHRRFHPADAELARMRIRQAILRYWLCVGEPGLADTMPPSGVVRL